MISGKNIGFFFLLIFVFSCQPKGSPEDQTVDWASDIFLEDYDKQILGRYFRQLDAKRIDIYSDASYEDEDSEQLLFVDIVESEFLATKTIEQKEKVTERLAFLIFSHISYPHSFQNITLSFYDNPESIEENFYKDSFQRSFMPEQFTLKMKEEIDEETEYTF